MFSFLTSLLALGLTLLERMREMADEELVLHAQRQDLEGKEAFRVLIERHEGMLMRVLVNLVHNRSDAEELLQNAMTRAFFALPKFRGDASFKTWVRTIAIREAYNHHRRFGARPESPSDLIEDTIEADEISGQERLAEREALQLALEHVPYPYREILVLRYIEGLSLEEIGEMLELGKSATKMRLKRAREFFQSAYEGQDAA
ncbi:MAG: RNA polymerase sigma factor [Myxococcota bacterium]|nr:RNA polymerase sigma factor [Myxococcota bacterium]